MGNRPAVLQNFFYKYVYNPNARAFSTIGGSFWADHVFGNESFAQEKVNEYRAHKIATVYTCINVRAQTISALPGGVFREKGGKKELMDDHPTYFSLAHEPNDYLTSANYFLTQMIHSDSWGNSYSFINQNFKGQAESFDLLNPWDVTPQIENGQVFYKYKGEMIPGRKILHFRWWSYDGVCGVSPIRLHANTIGKAIKEDRYSSMSLGAKPPGLLSYDGDLKPEQRVENKEEWKKNAAVGETPVLSGRWTYTPIMIPPDDAQYIDSTKLTDQKIYGIYRIPPVFAQNFERATFTNAEQSDLVFVKHTIVPLVRVMEQEINKKCFTEKEKKNHYWKFNLNGLLRGDSAARKEFYQSMINTGVYNRNEVRSLEDLNAYPGGDDFLVQSGMIAADQLRDFHEKKLMPTVPNGERKFEMNGHGRN